MVSFLRGVHTALLSTALSLPIALSSFSGWSFSFVRMFTLHTKVVPSCHHHFHVTSPACALVLPHWGGSVPGPSKSAGKYLVWLCAGAAWKCWELAKAHFLPNGLRLFPTAAASGCETQDNWAVALWSEQMGQSHALGRKDPAERKWKGMFFLAVLCAEGALMVWVAIFLLLWNWK